MHGWEFRVLGPLQVRYGNSAIPISAAKQRVLLAALAVAGREAVSADSLIRWLWDDSPPAGARNTLKNYALRVRRTLAGTAGENPILTTPNGYRLATPVEAVDLYRFQALEGRARAEATAGALATADELLARALRLWRGAPLADVPSDALHQEIVPGLVERHLSTVELGFEIALRRGRHGQVVTDLLALCRRHPLRERLWVMSMLALYRCGRTAEALTTYREAATVLSEELGADPGPELQSLHEQVLRQDSGLHTGTGYGLDHTAGPVVVHRPGEALDGRRQAPPGHDPAGTRMPPRQLPSAVTGFVGRAAELRLLRDIVRDHLKSADPVRSVLTVVVHGVGGVGKTALAVRWAHQVADRFPDGQLYLDLQGYGPANAVGVAAALGALLHALGVPERAMPVTVDERSALLRTVLTGKRVLVVLDNAKDADQVRPLVPGAGCLVVVTSRGVMRGLCVRDGARSLHLREMSEPEAIDLLAETTGNARIAGEAAAASDLARLCGHLPLALRITADLASRHPETPLSELATSLRAQRLETLADPVDDAADPRVAFSWSYRQLHPVDARVFRLLSLSPGNHFSVAAAAALVDRPVVETRRALDRLVAVHLLEQRSPTRFQYHDLLREYAAELTEAEDPPAAREAAVSRVLWWYTRMSMGASRSLAPGRQLWNEDTAPDPSQFGNQLAALNWFEAERDNVGVAVRRAASVGAYDLAWRIASALTAYFAVDPLREEWEATYQAALSSAERLGDRIAMAAIMTGLGTVRGYLGRDEEAAELYTKALAAFEAEGVRAQQATVLVLMANALEGLGRHAGARRRYQAGLDIACQLGDRAREAHALSNLAITATSTGEYEEAVAHSRRCLLLRRETGDERGRAHTLDNLGDALIALDRHEEAIACFEEAAAIARTYRDRRNEGLYLGNLARAQWRAGRPHLARRTAAEAWPALAGVPDADAEKVKEHLRTAFPDLA